MSDIDKQFIEYVVKSLVEKPDAVHIDRRIDEKGVLLELTVDPEDLGRVIGKRGATAQSLRTLLRALGTKNDARYNLKIVDNGPEGGHRSESSARQPANDSAAQAADDTSSTSTDITADEPEEAAPQGGSEEVTADGTSDRLRQAREELAELDDLDV